MKTKVSVLVAFLALIALTNCKPFEIVRGDGNVVTRNITIDDYDKIEAAHCSKIIYTQSEDAPALSVTVDENILDKFDIKVSGNKLEIKPKEAYKRALFRPTEFTIVTNSKELSKVDIAGSTDFDLNNPFTGEKLDVDFAGSGTININDDAVINILDIDLAGSSTINAYKLNGKEFDGDIAGSGKVNLGGTMAKAKFSIAGSGTIRAFDLQVEDLKCDIAGSGDIEISVSNSINASVAGSGRIKYKGDPQEIKKDIAGSGSVKKVD